MVVCQQKQTFHCVHLAVSRKKRLNLHINYSSDNSQNILVYASTSKIHTFLTSLPLVSLTFQHLEVHDTRNICNELSLTVLNVETISTSVNRLLNFSLELAVGKLQFISGSNILCDFCNFHIILYILTYFSYNYYIVWCFWLCLKTILSLPRLACLQNVPRLRYLQFLLP